MNKPIRRLSVVFLGLFLALLLNASYVQYFQADELNDRAGNRRIIDAEFSRERGAILVAGGPVAESVPSEDRFEFQRRYPEPLRHAHVTGFYSYEFGAAAVELTQNPILSGSDPRLFVDRLVDMVSSTQPTGGSVSLTLDPGAQVAAFDGLRALGESTQGAAVALEPATGRVLAMVSNPTYDPNVLASHDLSDVRDAWKRLLDAPGDPLVNRAIQETYPPGSTFKLVTAAAALGTGDYDPDTMVPGGATLDLPQSTATLPNSGGGDCGGEKVTLTQALMVSCNVSFGAIGLDIGADAMRQQAESFGFGERFLRGLSGQAASRFPPDPDPPSTALSAIGQFDVAATPLQMALVTATIANNGQGMVPYLVEEIRAPDLNVLEKTDPEEMPDQAMSPRAAAQLTQMMVEVVDRGTGTTAQLPGIKVAGKTGTAQSSEERAPYAWFVSFAPADDPQVAVAVLVEDAGVDRNAISGSGLAAPIARAVMEAVIGS